MIRPAAGPETTSVAARRVHTLESERPRECAIPQSRDHPEPAPGGRGSHTPVGGGRKDHRREGARGGGSVLDAQRRTFEHLGCIREDACPDLSGADEVFLTIRAWRSWNTLGP